MSITDGTFICSLCGESLTGCALCGEAQLVDVSASINYSRARRQDSERELWKQEQAIRRAADARQGYRD